MDRRQFIQNVGVQTMTAKLAGAARQGPGQRRRAVLIMTDTTRWDMLNCYRNTGLKTPSLDRLAAGGIRFERAYTTQPVCGPARAGLFTGLYPHSTAAWANSMALDTTVHHIGQRLSDKGIHTAYMGKWHLDGADYFGTGRCPAGWDKNYWFDGRKYLEELSSEDRVRSRQTKTNRDPKLAAEFTYAHKVSNRAVSFLEKHGDEDFLLVASYDEPHGPFLCPKPYSEMYRGYTFPAAENQADSLASKPEHQRLWAGPRLGRPPQPVRSPDYFGCHTFVDHEIGRVLDAIDRYAPDALVIYTSDHGDFLTSHRLTGKGPATYDEIARIPFLVRWPGRAPANAACPHPVSHIDVVPTLMEAFGYEVPKPLQGKSLMPTIKDPKVRTNDQVFVEFNRFEIDHDGFGGFQPLRGVFDGRFKLTINLLETDELYDLEKDPQEMRNLIGSPEHAAKRNELHDRLIDWIYRTRDPFRGYYWRRRSWRPDQVASYNDLGMTRQREDDGYEPRQLVYETGLEMKDATRTK